MAPVYFLGWVRVTLKTVERISKQFDAYILAVSSFQFESRCELLNRNKGGIINEIRSLVTRIETLVSLSIYTEEQQCIFHSICPSIAGEREGY